MAVLERNPSSKELMGLGDEYWVGEINDAMDDDQNITEFAHIRTKYHIDVEEKDMYLKQFEAIFEQIRQKKKRVPGPNMQVSKQYNPLVNVAIDEATQKEQSSIEHVPVCSVENHKSTEVNDLLTECYIFKRFIDILKKWKNKDAKKGKEKVFANYTHQQLFDDFSHIKSIIATDNDKIRDHDHAQCEKKHNDDEKHECSYASIGTKIFEYVDGQFPCRDAKNCSLLKKHCRIDVTNQSVTEEKECVEDIALHHAWATIHSYFFHSSIRFGVKSYQINVEGEYYLDEITTLKLARIDNRGYFQKEPKILLDRMNSRRQDEKTNDSENKSQKQISYVGVKEDNEWWSGVKPNDKKQTKEEIYSTLVEKMGVFRWQNPHGFAQGKNQEVAKYTPKQKNIKDEVLNNKYEPLSKENWNETLRKSEIFYKSWARQKIRTITYGSYYDQITGQKAQWKKDEQISMKEIVTLKLYTDFDKLQFQLKKCFRFEAFDDILEKNDKRYKQIKEELKIRLQEFYHWRGALLIALNKFGTKLKDKNNMSLYHGVNCKMIIKPNQTYAFSGPLSTTSSYHVARTFATAKGMILKINSYFPRLNYCNAFDVSLISDYPEEEEWLVGFMYVRILQVKTRKLVDDMSQFDCTRRIVCHETGSSFPLSSWVRQQFFAIHLFNEQILTMSEDLERILAQFLRVNRKECCKYTYNIEETNSEQICSDDNKECEEKKTKYCNDHIKCDDWGLDKMAHYMCLRFHNKGKTQEEIEKALIEECKDETKRDEIAENFKKYKTDDEYKKKSIIFEVLWKKFNEFREKPNARQCVKFDTISNYLKRFFMVESKYNEKDIETGTLKWIISFDEITTVYPNVKEIHFINEYELTDEVLDDLLTQINKEKNKIEKIVFLYYNYKETNDAGKPIEKSGLKFKDPEKLNKDKIKAVEKAAKGWMIKEGKNGKSGYKIRIQAKKR